MCHLQPAPAAAPSAVKLMSDNAMASSLFSLMRYAALDTAVSNSCWLHLRIVKSDDAAAYLISEIPLCCSLRDVSVLSQLIFFAVSSRDYLGLEADWQCFWVSGMIVPLAVPAHADDCSGIL